MCNSMRDSNGGGQRRPRCLASLWRPRPKGQSTSSATAAAAALRVRCPGALKSWCSGDRETILVSWDWLLPDSSPQSHFHGWVRSLRVLLMEASREVECLPSKRKRTNHCNGWLCSSSHCTATILARRVCSDLPLSFPSVGFSSSSRGLGLALLVRCPCM